MYNYALRPYTDTNILASQVVFTVLRVDTLYISGQLIKVQTVCL